MAMSFKEKCEAFQKTIATAEDREAHAQAMGEVILEQLPSESTVRNIYTVDELPPGTTSSYTLDIDKIDAWYLPKMGEAPVNLVTAEEVFIPTFEVTADVSYKMKDARDGHFSIAERARQRLLDSIVNLEEDAGWSVLKAACGSANTVSDTSGTGGTPIDGLTKKLINAAYTKLQSNRGVTPTDLYISSTSAGDMRDWEYTTIDPTTQREILVQGGMGSLWNVTIHSVYFLGDDEGYMLDTTPDKLGYMPIRQNLFTFDDPTAPKVFRVGIIAYEDIGFGVLDTTRIVKLDIQRTP